jgi:hypothetical protein
MFVGGVVVVVSVVHELCEVLGRESILTPLLQELDCSLEDFEILSKLTVGRHRPTTNNKHMNIHTNTNMNKCNNMVGRTEDNLATEYSFSKVQ